MVKPLAQGVQKEEHRKIIYKVKVPRKRAHQPKAKITREHPYKEWGISTNPGNRKQKPPV